MQLRTQFATFTNVGSLTGWLYFAIGMGMLPIMIGFTCAGALVITTFLLEDPNNSPRIRRDVTVYSYQYIYNRVPTEKDKHLYGLPRSVKDPALKVRIVKETDR